MAEAVAIIDEIPTGLVHVQEQKWHNTTRVLLFDGVASVQMELYDEEQKWGGTAFIYALWVNKDFRRQGRAKKLLDIAESIIKQRGHKSAILEWDKRDTPYEVLDYYVSRGYNEFEFGKFSSVLKKEL
jgi:ribosomal protein S18 acetylase RimI-like enzyme